MTPSATHFVLKSLIPSSTKRDRKKKISVSTGGGWPFSGTGLGPKTEIEEFWRKKFLEKKNVWLVLEWVTPSVTLFVLKFQFRAQLSEIGKKNVGWYWRGWPFSGTDMGPKTEIGEIGGKKNFGKKKIVWLVLEWVTPLDTLFVLKFQFRAQLSEIGWPLSETDNGVKVD